MSGLLLKDFYTIGHNAKQMMLILLIWAFCFLPGRDGSTYIIICGSLCGMMTATTFTFDDHCHWEKYAMILPISKKTYVLEKYVLHIIFSLLGIVVSTVVSVVANRVRGVAFEDPVWLVGLVGFGVSMAVGCVFLPLLLQYGSEKARIILLGTVIFPVILFFVLEYFMDQTGIISANQIETFLKWSLPPGFVVLLIISVLISLKIFEKKEF